MVRKQNTGNIVTGWTKSHEENKQGDIKLTKQADQPTKQPGGTAVRWLQPQVRESGKVSGKKKPGRDLQSGKPKAHRLQGLQDRELWNLADNLHSAKTAQHYLKEASDTFPHEAAVHRRLLSKRPQVPLCTRLAYTNTIMNFSWVYSSLNWHTDIPIAFVYLSLWLTKLRWRKALRCLSKKLLVPLKPAEPSFPRKEKGWVSSTPT